MVFEQIEHRVHIKHLSALRKRTSTTFRGFGIYIKLDDKLYEMIDVNQNTLACPTSIRSKGKHKQKCPYINER
jgi:hypothetical protein